MPIGYFPSATVEAEVPEDPAVIKTRFVTTYFGSRSFVLEECKKASILKTDVSTACYCIFHIVLA